MLKDLGQEHLESPFTFLTHQHKVKRKSGKKSTAKDGWTEAGRHVKPVIWSSPQD